MVYPGRGRILHIEGGPILDALSLLGPGPPMPGRTFVTLEMGLVNDSHRLRLGTLGINTLLPIIEYSDPKWSGVPV